MISDKIPMGTMSGYLPNFCVYMKGELCEESMYILIFLLILLYVTDTVIFSIWGLYTDNVKMMY